MDLLEDSWISMAEVVAGTNDMGALVKIYSADHGL